MSIVVTSFHSLCMRSFCSVAAACCPSDVWKILFETHPVAMNRLFGCPQLEDEPESIMAVCWWHVSSDGRYMLFIVVASSTDAVSGSHGFMKFLLFFILLLF